MCTCPVQPICTFSCTSVFFIFYFLLILLFTVYCIAHFISLHILLFLFYYLFPFSFSPIFIYIFSCVMFHCFYCLFIFIFSIYYYYYYYYYYSIFLHFPLSGPVLSYISLLIIPCMIVYVTNNKEPQPLNPP